MKDVSLMKKEVVETSENNRESNVEEVMKDSYLMEKEAVVRTSENSQESDVEEVLKDSSLMEKEVVEMSEINQESDVEDVPKGSSLMEKEVVVEMSENNQGSGVEEVPKDSSLMENEVVETSENTRESDVEEVLKDSSLMEKEVVETIENDQESNVEDVLKDSSLMGKEVVVEMSENNQGSCVEEVPKDSSLMENEIVVETSENNQKSKVKEVLKDSSLMEKEVVELSELNQESGVEDVPKGSSLMEKEIIVEMSENNQGSGVEEVPKDSSLMEKEDAVEMSQTNQESDVEDVPTDPSFMEKEVVEMSQSNQESNVGEVMKNSSLMKKEVVEMSEINQESDVEVVVKNSTLMKAEVVEISGNNQESNVDEVMKDSSWMKKVVEMSENNQESGVEEVLKDSSLMEKEVVVEMNEINQEINVDEVMKEFSLMEKEVVEISENNRESNVKEVLKDLMGYESEKSTGGVEGSGELGAELGALGAKEEGKSDVEMAGATRKKGRKKKDATRLRENTLEPRRTSRAKPNITYIEEPMFDEDYDEGCAGKKRGRKMKENKGDGQKKAPTKGEQSASNDDGGKEINVNTSCDGESGKSTGGKGSGESGIELRALGCKEVGKSDFEMTGAGSKKGRKKGDATRLAENTLEPRRSSRGKPIITYIEESMSDEDYDEGCAGKNIVRSKKKIKGYFQRKSLMKGGQTSSDGESEKSSGDEGSGELGTEVGALGIKEEEKGDVEMAGAGRKKGRKKRDAARLGENASDRRISSRGKPNINYIEESMSDEDYDEGCAEKKIVRNREGIKGNRRREALMKGGQTSSDGEFEKSSDDEGSGEFGTELGALGIKEEKWDDEMASAGRKKGRKKRDATRLGNASDPRRSSRGKPNINYIEESMSEEDYDDGCAGKKIGRNRKEIKGNGQKKALMKGEQTSSDGESEKSSGDESTGELGTELGALGSKEEEIWDVKRAGAVRKKGQKKWHATRLGKNTLETRRSCRGKPNINYIEESMPDEDCAGKIIGRNRKEMKGNEKKEALMKGGQIAINDGGQEININSSTKGESKKLTGDEGSGELGTESGSLGCKEEEKWDVESPGAGRKKGRKKRDATQLDENSSEPRRSSRAKPNIDYIEEPMSD